MRIRYYSTKTKFADLAVNQLFYIDEKTGAPAGIFMKIRSTEVQCDAIGTRVSLMVNSVDLQTGTLYDMLDNSQVVPCEGHIEIVLETK